MKATRAKSELDFFQLFDKLISDLRTGRKRLPNGGLYKKGSIDAYIYVRKNLADFCAEKNFHLRLQKVKNLTQRQILVEKNYWKKFHKKFTDWLYAVRNYKDNFVGYNMKVIRAFFNYVKKDLAVDIGSFHSQFYVYKEEIPIITLTQDQLQFLIYNKEFEETLTERLKRTKDIFVFGCAVALRYSDLMSLTRANLIKAEGDYYLRVRSIKTKTYTQALLPDYAVEISKKYKAHAPHLLPQISNFNLNKAIKELTEKAGWIEPIGKKRERRGKLKEIKIETRRYRFCDIVSAHTMRRTAITTMLTMGVPEHIVRSMSGHSAMSKEFFRYVSISQIYKDREIKKMHQKLKIIA